MIVEALMYMALVLILAMGNGRVLYAIGEKLMHRSSELGQLATAAFLFFGLTAVWFMPAGSIPITLKENKETKLIAGQDGIFGNCVTGACIVIELEKRKQ